MSKKELPVIDLRLAKGSTRGALVKQLREALTTVGFIYLKGVEGFDEVELLRLTKWFYRSGALNVKEIITSTQLGLVFVFSTVHVKIVKLYRPTVPVTNIWYLVLYYVSDYPCLTWTSPQSADGSEDEDLNEELQS